MRTMTTSEQSLMRRYFAAAGGDMAIVKKALALAKENSRPDSFWQSPSTVSESLVLQEIERLTKRKPAA
ncbi:MAG: hypothetical protein AAGH82_10540 [Pseudomonadota bacterium]